MRTDGGDVVEARIVVCDTTPRGLLALAQDALPDAYVRRLVAFRYGPSTVKVDWALDGPVPWAASLPRTAGTVHLGGTAGEITEALRRPRPVACPSSPFLLFGQQSVADPTRAPAGKHTAWAYTHVPRSIDWARELEPFTSRASRRRSSASRPASAT